MFSLKIIDSAKFLKMPSSSRLLYYDLGMRADDDGIVEAFTTLRMTGATEDDLRVLVSKGYITILNEDLVSFITDWNEHNKIRADRKVDSIYKDLLLQVNPDVQLIEPRERADRKKESGTSQGQPKDGIGKDRLGKVSLVEDRLGNTLEQPPVDSTKERFEYLWDLYPNKKGKKQAFAAFQRAVKKGTSIDTIREGIKAYVRYINESKIESKYIKQGSTFFKQEAWNDDWTPQRPKGSVGGFLEELQAW